MIKINTARRINNDIIMVRHTRARRDGTSLELVGLVVARMISSSHERERGKNSFNIYLPAPLVLANRRQRGPVFRARNFRVPLNEKHFRGIFFSTAQLEKKERKNEKEKKE